MLDTLLLNHCFKMKNISTLVLFLMLLLAGCSTKPKDFQLIFTIESIESYKISIEINQDKSFLIQQQNLFFDAHANKERINTSQGKMTDEEFAELQELIAESRLFKMKDAYGFNGEADGLDSLFGNLMYQIYYKEGKKAKYISIRPNPSDTYPEKFPMLLNFLNSYISGHHSPM